MSTFSSPLSSPEHSPPTSPALTTLPPADSTTPTTRPRRKSARTANSTASSRVPSPNSVSLRPVTLPIVTRTKSYPPTRASSSRDDSPTEATGPEAINNNIQTSGSTRSNRTPQSISNRDKLDRKNSMSRASRSNSRDTKGKGKEMDDAEEMSPEIEAMAEDVLEVEICDTIFSAASNDIGVESIEEEVAKDDPIDTIGSTSSLLKRPTPIQLVDSPLTPDILPIDRGDNPRGSPLIDIPPIEADLEQDREPGKVNEVSAGDDVLISDSFVALQAESGVTESARLTTVGTPDRSALKSEPVPELDIPAAPTDSGPVPSISQLVTSPMAIEGSEGSFEIAIVPESTGSLVAGGGTRAEIESELPKGDQRMILTHEGQSGNDVIDLGARVVTLDVNDAIEKGPQIISSMVNSATTTTFAGRPRPVVLAMCDSTTLPEAAGGSKELLTQLDRQINDVSTRRIHAMTPILSASSTSSATQVLLLEHANTLRPPMTNGVSLEATVGGIGSQNESGPNLSLPADIRSLTPKDIKRRFNGYKLTAVLALNVHLIKLATELQQQVPLNTIEFLELTRRLNSNLRYLTKMISAAKSDYNNQTPLEPPILDAPSTPLLGPRLATSYEQLKSYFSASERYDQQNITSVSLPADPIPVHDPPIRKLSGILAPGTTDQAAEDGSLRERERLNSLSEINIEVATSPSMNISSRRGSLAVSRPTTAKRERDDTGEAKESKHRRLSSGATLVNNTTDLINSPDPSAAPLVESPGSISRVDSPFKPPSSSSLNTSVFTPQPPVSVNPLQSIQSPAQQQFHQLQQQQQQSHRVAQQQAYMRQQQASALAAQHHAMSAQKGSPSQDLDRPTIGSDSGRLSRPGSAIPFHVQSMNPLPPSAKEQYASLHAMMSSPAFLTHPPELRQQIQMNAQQLMHQIQAEQAVLRQQQLSQMANPVSSNGMGPLLGTGSGGGNSYAGMRSYTQSPQLGGGARGVRATSGGFAEAGVDSSAFFREQLAQQQQEQIRSNSPAFQVNYAQPGNPANYANIQQQRALTQANPPQIQQNQFYQPQQQHMSHLASLSSNTTGSSFAAPPPYAPMAATTDQPARLMVPPSPSLSRGAPSPADSTPKRKTKQEKEKELDAIAAAASVKSGRKQRVTKKMRAEQEAAEAAEEAAAEASSQMEKQKADALASAQSQLRMLQQQQMTQQQQRQQRQQRESGAGGSNPAMLYQQQHQQQQQYQQQQQQQQRMAVQQQQRMEQQYRGQQMYAQQQQQSQQGTSASPMNNNSMNFPSQSLPTSIQSQQQNYTPSQLNNSSFPPFHSQNLSQQQQQPPFNQLSHQQQQQQLFLQQQQIRQQQQHQIQQHQQSLQHQHREQQQRQLHSQQQQQQQQQQLRSSNPLNQTPLTISEPPVSESEPIAWDDWTN